MDHWKSKTIGDVILQIADGGTPSRNQKENFGGNHCWIVIDDIRDEIYDTKEKLTDIGLSRCPSFYWDEGTVILSTGATIGEVGITKVKAVTKQGISGIVVDTNEITNTYLKYFFQLNKERIKSLAQGSTIKEVRPPVVKGINITYPPTITEQNTIAEILSTADEAIEQTEKLIAKYQRIKTGLMQDLLTRGIDEHGNIRSKATHKFVIKNGIEVPKEWDVKALNDCIDKSTMITYGIVQTGPHIEDGIRVLRTIDLQGDRIISKSLLRTTEEISNSYKRTILKKYDIVCNVRASVGDFNIIDDDNLVGCNTTRGVARISPNSDINPYYLLWYLRTEKNKRRMELLIKGTTFIDINIADLRKIPIPIPKFLKEQEQISSKLNQINKLIESTTIRLYKLHSIKTGLMQDLLNGRVRVKVPPNYT